MNGDEAGLTAARAAIRTMGGNTEDPPLVLAIKALRAIGYALPDAVTLAIDLFRGGHMLEPSRARQRGAGGMSGRAARRSLPKRQKSRGRAQQIRLRCLELVLDPEKSALFGERSAADDAVIVQPMTIDQVLARARAYTAFVLGEDAATPPCEAREGSGDAG